ncbi:hypothetical protein K440DRAFT_621840 [Wilcoxina mikolae CBS 423.85]|nr:hypothetical protein K440DRAFT_621840 [Wilcoxina mikolae CBS 423.85]
MYSYAGKFSHNHRTYADNELFTVTFPTTIARGNTVIVVFQWTERADGTKKVNDIKIGSLTNAETDSDGKIHVKFLDDEYYKYSGVVSPNKQQLKLDMTNTSNESVGKPDLQLVHSLGA